MRRRSSSAAPSRTGWQAAAVALTVGVWACSEAGLGDDAGETGAEMSVELELLRSVADNAYAPSYAAFADAAQALTDATQAHLDAVTNAGDTLATAEAARLAWAAAWASWQELELMHVGPAGASANYVAGEDRRDEVYSWPSTNPCRVDQELVLGEFDNADFEATRLVNTYGLDALEYLLHYEGEANSCAPQLPINAEGEWEALSADEIAQRRAAYAAAIAVQLQGQADTLAAQWADGGDAREHLRDPEGGDSPYASTNEALDEVTRAMFYLETQLKDAKLGAPGGILGCASPTCLDELESAYAGASKAAALANLEGFRRVYYGGEDADSGFGFDDALASVGRDDLATQMNEAIDAARTALAVVGGDDGGFRDALLADDTALDEAYAAIKVITDLLKGEFTMALALKVPSEAGGDAD